MMCDKIDKDDTGDKDGKGDWGDKGDWGEGDGGNHRSAIGGDGDNDTTMDGGGRQAELNKHSIRDKKPLSHFEA